MAIEMETPLCEFLKWDSTFFGLRIARLTTHCLTPAEVESAGRWCIENRIDCLYFLAASDDGETALLAQRSGYEFVDVRLTLDCSLEIGRPDGSDVRLFRPSDAEPLRAIARVSHRDSRFYFDPRFPRERCDALYAAWIERSFSGWADTVLVADCGGEPAGYISCHLHPASGSIGLLAVAPEKQGKGLGRQLVAAALAYFRSRGMPRATVVTQGRNVGSQRLYQACGFRTRTVQLWYHRWFEREA